ncbi:MAG: LysR substrate-binding domain-containing protein [Alphaproteobacteria bacterium]
MNIRQLRYFLKIVELKSFSKASKHLRIAQPALGLQVQKLEEELGVQLLVRHARGVTPTESGLLLYEHAKIILRLLERARNEVIEIADSPRGEVAIGLTPTVSLMVGASLVETYRTACPNVSLRVVDGLSEILVEWVAMDRLDLAFTYTRAGTAGLVREPLVEERLYLVGPGKESSLGRGKVAFERLSDLPLILPSQPHILRTLVDEAAAAQGVDLNIHLEIDSVQTMKKLVERSIGYTVLPFGAVRSEVAEGRVSASQITAPELTRTLYVVFSNRRPPSKAFSILRDVIQQVVEAEVKVGSGSWRDAKERART